MKERNEEAQIRKRMRRMVRKVGLEAAQVWAREQLRFAEEQLQAAEQEAAAAEQRADEWRGMGEWRDWFGTLSTERRESITVEIEEHLRNQPEFSDEMPPKMAAFMAIALQTDIPWERAIDMWESWASGENTSSQESDWALLALSGEHRVKATQMKGA